MSGLLQRLVSPSGHPILFSAPMVRAIIEGHKTQTRRIVKPQPIRDGKGHWIQPKGSQDRPEGANNDPPYGWGMAVWSSPDQCPYGCAGDHLWVREKHLYRGNGEAIVYAADFDSTEAAGLAGMYGGWRPSIHMRRTASRITLEITEVRVERLKDISDFDAVAEGVRGWVKDPRCETPRDGFRVLWESINGEGSWAANPWVWVVEFQRYE